MISTLTRPRPVGGAASSDDVAREVWPNGARIVGFVRAIHATPGTAVEKGTRLVEFEELA